MTQAQHLEKLEEKGGTRAIFTPEKPLVPVDVGCVQPEFQVPCDLYTRVGEDSYLFLIKKGTVFDRRQRERLSASGIRSLYIQNDDLAIYFGYMRDTLTTIVRDPATGSQRKAEVVHASCKDIMHRVFVDPRASFLTQAHAIISPTVDLIVTDDTATRCLIRLTAYDHQTYIHSTNVGIFSIALARLMYGNDSTHDMNRLGAGFFLHDMGKCKIPIEILNKPASLTPAERQIVNRHPEDGYKLLEENGFLTDEASIITLQHHERDDGSGYPHGLWRDDIHPYARICRMADVYEALTAERPYHKPRSTFDALKFMTEKVVSDMDRDILHHFVQLFL